MVGGSRKENQKEVKRLSQRRSKKTFRRVVGWMFVAAVVCVYLANSYVNRTFDSYEVMKTIDREDAGATQYISYQNQVLRVSRDGTSAIDASGNITFNGSYEMSHPQVDISGDYIAVADVGGYDVYVYDGTDSGKKLTMTLPIVQVQVARQGVIAVWMQDKESDLIQLYRTDESVDSLLIEYRTYVENNGFPVTMALSDDGRKLVTAYVRVKNGILQNQVTFYNFSSVGQNYVGQMMAMNDYESSIVADVQFIGNDAIAVYLENGFEIFTMREEASSSFKVTFEEEITKTFHSDEYVGFILQDNTEDSINKVVVYSLDGKQVLNKKIDYTFTSVSISEEEILFYSELECAVLKLNGVEKFVYEFDTEITNFLPINNYNEYYVIDPQQINIVKLTEG